LHTVSHSSIKKAIPFDDIYHARTSSARCVRYTSSSVNRLRAFVAKVGVNTVLVEVRRRICYRSLSAKAFRQSGLEGARHMTILRRVTLALFVLSMTATSAQATPSTLNYDFSATGFEAAGAPVDPVTGSFSVTFDNATDLTDVTSGISLTGLNISLGSAPAFTYSQTTIRW
jgi:hypothetical protein